MLAVDSSVDVGSLSAGLGIIAAALVVGQGLFYKFVHNPTVERLQKDLDAERSRCSSELVAERERAKRLEEKIDRQSLVLEDKALPALIAATSTVSQFQTLMETIRREQETLQHEREVEEAIRNRRPDVSE